MSLYVAWSPTLRDVTNRHSRTYGLKQVRYATLLTLVCGVVGLRTVTEYRLTYLQATGGSGNGG